MTKYLDRIAACPADRPKSFAQAFSAFPPASAAALRAAAVHQCWQNGAVVLAKDRVVPWVLTILRGRLRISASSGEGHMVFLRWQLAGETVGLASAVSGLPLPVEIAAFDDCETLHVEREFMLELMRSDADTACSAARHVATHAYDLIHHLTARTEQTLTARVYGVLRHLATLNGSPITGTSLGLRLEISQQGIADAVGASRQRVNHELRALELGGQIKLGYRHIDLLWESNDTGH